MDSYPLVPIGVVHSPIQEPAAMPAEGVQAEVEVFAEFAPALDAIENNSHLVILGWLHRARRDVLRAAGRSGEGERGVFGLRSSARPNPIGMDVARLLGVDRDLRMLSLDRLDLIDGTPVVDIKRYSPPWDSVFAARSSRDVELGRRSRDELRDELARAAVNFHGEWCRGGAMAVRLLADALSSWKVGPRNERLVVGAGRDGCLTDALQGMTGATIGNRRFIPGQDPAVALTLADRERWVFHPAADLRDPPDDLVRRRLKDLGELDVLTISAGRAD